MKAIVIRVLLTSLFFSGCGTKKADEKPPANDTATAVTAQSENSADRVENAGDYTGCVRGAATPVINRSIFSHAVFQLNADHFTGTETLDLKNGDKLIITNDGCEYYVLTFRFETERFQADTTNTAYWLDKAVVLMNEIEKGIDAPLDIKKGIDIIPIYLSSLDSRSYSLGEEIIVNDGDIRDFVVLDRIQKISDTRFAIEIAFAKGPL